MSEIIGPIWLVGTLVTWMAAFGATEHPGKSVGYALLWPIALLYALALAIRLAGRDAVRRWRTL